MGEIEIKEQVHLLVDESDEQILRAVKAMLEAYHSEKWTEEQVKDFNADIEVSENEYKNGDFIMHEEVIKLSDQWQHQNK